MPFARWAATGEKMSRPWKVRETRSSQKSPLGELVSGLDAAETVGGGKQQAVVGADVQAAVAAAQRERAAESTDTGVDDGHMHADREVRESVREGQSALQNRLPPDAVRQVDHPRGRCNPCDHAVADPDEVVSQAEVGEEGDEWLSRLGHRGPSTSSAPVVSAATARPYRAAESIAATRPSRSNVRACPASSRPASRTAADV